MYAVNLMRERPSEDQIWSDTFLAENSLEDPEEAIRSAVKEFLANAGKKNITMQVDKI